MVERVRFRMSGPIGGGEKGVSIADLSVDFRTMLFFRVFLDGMDGSEPSFRFVGPRTILER